MGNVMLISTAYGWFIGLLVMMLVLTVLFIFIALVALKPYKLDKETSESNAALTLLNEKEAELINKLLYNPGDEAVLNHLKEVATAKLIVRELLGEDIGIAPNGNPEHLGVDEQLTEEEAQSLEEEAENVPIEQTFGGDPEVVDGEGLEKSFTAKLMQSHDDVKVWYFELKNCILCYEKTKARMRWNNEKFYIGRTNVATLTLRGRQLCLYLAVRPEGYAGRFPVKKSTSKMYNEVTPCLFRIKNAKMVKQAKELIALMMSDYGVMYVRTNHSIYALPYEDDDALVAKGLARQSQDKKEY